MTRLAPSTFSLRAFFAFTTVLAVLCAARQFHFAFLIGFVAALNWLLLLTGAQIAKGFPSEAKRSRHGRLAARSSPTFCTLPPTPVLVSVGYLHVFAFWHYVLIVMVPYFAISSVPNVAISSEWYSAFLPGLSLYTIHTTTLVALNVFLIGSYLADCYGTGKVRTTNSLATAATSTVLLLAHFAAPVR